MTTFSGRQTEKLLSEVVPPTISSSSNLSDSQRGLQAHLLALNPPIAGASNAVNDALLYLQKLQTGTPYTSSSFKVGYATADVDDLDTKLALGVLSRVAVTLYAQILEEHLAQASSAEREAEWWADVERSHLSTLQYLIQTLPLRVVKVLQEILGALRSQNQPVRLSSFSASSIRSLFPPTNPFAPGPLLSAFYPHLRRHPHTLSLSLPRISTQTASISGATTLASSWISLVQTAATAPLALTTQECSLKCDALYKVRDDRAQELGILLSKRAALETGVKALQAGDARAYSDLVALCANLGDIIDSEGVVKQGNDDLVGHLSCLASYHMPSQQLSHTLHIKTLSRPSRLVLAWPRLLLLPPLALYGIRMVYNSRDALSDLASDAVDTGKRFWNDWILEPLQGIVKTIRAGSEEGMIVNTKGVAADIESLERMSMALAKDKLSYTSDQLAALSTQVRSGDLTPILRIYEDDIRSPLKSAVSGTLLRSVFIQVQKAKVDIDQALAGIDKLLKSQELTFAFVGVAPAFAILWTLAGALRWSWVGGSNRGRYGGRNARTKAFLAMRKIERLLVSSPVEDANALPPLTAGLLVLSVAHIRRYAERSLPVGSRIREGVLEDIQDLEDQALGQDAKIKVVERMWRCWGGPLGWTREGTH